MVSYGNYHGLYLYHLLAVQVQYSSNPGKLLRTSMPAEIERNQSLSTKLGVLSVLSVWADSMWVCGYVAY